MRIAVNFPYFIPYTGYFRLFTNTDLFVVFDCVPFPRRGYVHRNRLPGHEGKPVWLSLPVRRVPRDTLIRDMTLTGDSEARMDRQFQRFPLLRDGAAREHPLAARCRRPSGRLVDFVESTLALTAELLDLPFRTVRSSSLDIDPALRGEARVLEIARTLGATDYVNAPGGRHLYDRDRFKHAGIALRYLPAYQGPAWSILHRLLTESPRAIREDIHRQGIPA